MVKTKILISVIIVLLIGVTAAGYQISNTNPNLWQPTIPQDQLSTDQTPQKSVQSQSETPKTTSVQSQNGNGGSKVIISLTQAKSIANKSVEQPGATTGTPKLTKIDGKKVYIVPILYNGTSSGEIWIDAQTGENIGGAGGAP